jgi:DNA modification methylase
MGTFYRQKHEFVCIFKNGTARHINNFELGQHGRYRTNVWDAPVPRALRADHPTPKPVCLAIDAMKDCSTRHGVILDGFAGSGTTIIAAEKAGRIARCIELDPLYADVTVRRWQKFTGEKARLSGTKEAFERVARARVGTAASAAAIETARERGA